MSIPFIKDCSALPSTAPDEHPHVIDIGACTNQDYFDGDLKLWDAVATMLYNISPSTLDRFLDTTQKTFKLIQSSANASNEASLVIFKKDNEVIVGVYIEHANPRCFEWDHLVRCTIDSDGAWEIKYATYGLYSDSDWSAVWAGQFKNHGRGHVSPDDVSRGNKAKLQAEEIMTGELWDASLSKWTITSG